MREKIPTPFFIILVCLFIFIICASGNAGEIRGGLLVLNGGAAYPSETEITSDTILSDSASDLMRLEQTAFKHSLYGTLIPVATLVLAGPGIIVGPSLGYFYADMSGRALTGIGVRMAGMGGVVMSFVICGWDCGPGHNNYNTAWVVFISSLGVTFISAIYDISAVKENVRRHNESLIKKAGLIEPAYFANSGAVGFRIVLRL
jgi:hypothetical protein